MGGCCFKAASDGGTCDGINCRILPEGTSGLNEHIAWCKAEGYPMYWDQAASDNCFPTETDGDPPFEGVCCNDWSEVLTNCAADSCSKEGSNKADCDTFPFFYEGLTGNCFDLNTGGCVDFDGNIAACKEIGGGMIDDPHVLTFGNTWFDWHGECDVVLVHTPDFLPGKDLFLHARTRIRSNYSYIESAALRVGDDTLEVSSFGEYALNGVEGADLSSFPILRTQVNADLNSFPDLSSFPILHNQVNRKAHKYDVVLGRKTNITLSSFKDLVSVRIHGATKKQFGKSVGMMGSFPTGELLARNGTVMAVANAGNQRKLNAFGQEWQVRADEPMLFRTARAPQAPLQGCKFPSETVTQKRRRLGESSVSKEQAESACEGFKGDSHRFEACVSDGKENSKCMAVSLSSSLVCHLDLSVTLVSESPGNWRPRDCRVRILLGRICVNWLPLNEFTCQELVPIPRVAFDQATHSKLGASSIFIFPTLG